MRSLILLPCTLALSLGLPGAWRYQDPVPAGDDPPAPSTDEGPVARDLFGRPAPDDGSELHDKLQGAWQLVALEDPSLPVEGRSLHGLMIVSGTFLAIEMHAAWDDSYGNNIEDAFQTGMHEFELDTTGNLQMVSLIGSFLDEEEELDWEAPGTVREFRVTTDGAFLSLTRLDGSSLKFVRRRPRVGESRDIFGRPAEGSTTELTDIYGRPLPPPQLGGRDKEDGEESDG